MNTKRLGICTNCNQNEGKYRCPRCTAVTCSLNCCNQHKSNNNCSGIKDKIDFVPYNAMTGDLLRKDMKFLMNLSSKIQVSCRDPLLHQRQDRNTNDRFRSLCSAAKFKKIRLFLQPIGMAKHQNNQTYITKSQTNNKNILKTIHWTMSIQFGSHQLLLHDIHENDTLLSVLKNLKNDKFQPLKSNTIVSKIMNENKIFDSENNNQCIEIEHKDNVLHKYYKYFNDINLIRVPVLPKRKKRKNKTRIYSENNNENVSEMIARSVIKESVLPLFWNALSLNGNDNDKVVSDNEKLNVILKIPNHFMFIRINPMKSILEILKQKIISEYPEFIVLLPDDMNDSDNEYVIMDYMEHHQFDNCIKHNTKIQKQRDKLKMEMERKLNENKLFGGNNKGNRYQKYNKYKGKKKMGGYGKRFDERSNSNNCNNKNKNNSNENGLTVKDLFNGNIMNENNKRCYRDVNKGNRLNNNRGNNYGGYVPQMKKMKYNGNSNQKTFINPFKLNNSNKQQQKQNTNENNWYLYL